MALDKIHPVHFSAYKAACEEHAELKSFDSSLQERTNKVVKSITDQAKTGSLSYQATHMEVYGHLLEVSQVVAEFVTGSKAEVWEDEDLRNLVSAYFDNTTKTLEFFNSVDKYVNKAETGQLLIRSALEEFGKESAKTGDKKNKYEDTLKMLKKFKDMKEDLDGHELKAPFELVKKDQESLLHRVAELKEKLDEKIKESQAHKKVTNIIFGAAFVAVVVIGVATAAVGGAAVAAAAITGMTALLPLTAIGWLGTYTYLQRLEDTLKKRKEISGAIDESLEVNKNAMVTIHLSVEQLITTISSLLDKADLVSLINNEVFTKNTLFHIKEKVDAFTEKIKEVRENVDKNSKLAIEARNDVLAKIIRYGK